MKMYTKNVKMVSQYDLQWNKRGVLTERRLLIHIWYRKKPSLLKRNNSTIRQSKSIEKKNTYNVK